MAKPKPPTVNLSRVQEYARDQRERPPELRKLAALHARLRILEEQRKLGELTTTYIALDALGALAGAAVAGVPENKARAVWPEDWGQDEVKVPLALLLALRDAWAVYRDGPSGQTLGEAFGLEGRGQGKHKMRDRQKQRDRQRKLCAQVCMDYLLAPVLGEAISLEAAINQVAQREGVSFQTVREAHKRYRREIEWKMDRMRFVQHGLLSGLKTSRSPWSE